MSNNGSRQGDEWLTQTNARLMREEGSVDHMYCDSKGYVTVGVGCLLASAESAAELPFVYRGSEGAADKDIIVQEFERVKSEYSPEANWAASHYKQVTKLFLREDAIGRLLDEKIDGFDRDLCEKFPDFQSYPRGAKEALLDMAFNLGTAKLFNGFPTLMQAVQSKDWLTCAQQCHRRGISDERNKETAELFVNSASQGSVHNATTTVVPSSNLQQSSAPVLSGQQIKNVNNSIREEKTMASIGIWETLKKTVAPFAPTIASALGGPLAGVATKFIQDKLGADGGGDTQSLQQQVSGLLGDAKGLQQLKQIESDFKLEMEKLSIDVFSLEVDDRKSARELAKMDNKPHVLLSAIFITAYFLILIAVFYAEISPDFNPGSVKNKDGEWMADTTSLLDLMHVLLGVLTAGVGQILSFWFGGAHKRDGR